MKLIKQTAEYRVFQRRDGRYAVQDTNRNPINGDEKAKILVAEELITVALAAPEPEAVEEEAAEETEEVAAEAEEESKEETAEKAEGEEAPEKE